MKSRFVLAVLPLLLTVLCLPVRASGPGGIASAQADIQLDELERSAAENGGMADYGTDLDEGMAALFDTGTKELGGVVQRAAHSGVLILVILLFCSLAETVQDSVGKSRIRTVPLAGTLAVTGCEFSTGHGDQCH